MDRNIVFVLWCVIVGYIGETIGFVVVSIVSTISLHTNCDQVWISYCVHFVVPFKFSCIFMIVEFRLLLKSVSLNLVT